MSGVWIAGEKLESCPCCEKSLDQSEYDFQWCRGHVLVLWDDKLVPEYGPYRYGLGYNEFVHLQIVSLR